MLRQSATTRVPNEVPQGGNELPPRRAPHPFTQLPNAIYGLLPELDGSETKVLLVILRHTFGFQEYDRPAALGLSTFQREAGLSRETVVRALNLLVSRALVERSGEGTTRRRYRIIVPMPALVRESDQQLVRKPARPLVGNLDRSKESSSKDTSQEKAPCTRPGRDRVGILVLETTEATTDFLADDDAAPTAFLREGLSPEQEVSEIVRAKTGEPIRANDLRQIKEILELRAVALDSFVREVRYHLKGHWRNPIGFLMSLAKDFHRRTQVAIPQSDISINRGRECSCSWGFLQRDPDVFCNSCALGRDLARDSQRDERRKLLNPGVPTNTEGD